MHIVCLHLEGELIPEIWIAFSQRSGIAEFSHTDRDEPDYDQLMGFRLALLRQHGLKLADILGVIKGMAPMDGAKLGLDDLRRRYESRHPVQHLLRVCRPFDAAAGPPDADMPPARSGR